MGATVAPNFLSTRAVGQDDSSLHKLLQFICVMLTPILEHPRILWMSCSLQNAMFFPNFWVPLFFVECHVFSLIFEYPYFLVNSVIFQNLQELMIFSDVLFFFWALLK